MLQPAATVTRLRLLQANANVESASVKMKPPWQISWPFRWRSSTTMRITARPGVQLTSSMPMVSRDARSLANIERPTRSATSCSVIALTRP